MTRRSKLSYRTAMSTRPADAIPVYTHAQIVQVITGIMMCILLAALDQTVIIPAVPAIAAELNAFGHLAWIVTAYLLTSTAATPIVGKLSDSYGRRALLLPALALFIVASVLCALAQSLPQLIAARALQGLGGAGLMSMAQAAVADVVSPRERGRYQGYMASMWGVASIAGPVVGGYVTDHLSWRWIFWINLPLGLAAMWLCQRGLRVLPAPRGGGRLDLPGSALLVGGVTCWLLALSWGGTDLPWLSAPLLGLLAGGFALLLALGWWEGRAADPLLPPRLFRNPVFLRGVVTAFLTSFGLLGATFLLPLYFQLVFGADASRSGLLVMPFLASSVVGTVIGGQVSRRLGRTKAIVLTGLAACTLGFALLSLIGPGLPTAAVLACTVVLGTGLGATLPTVLVQVQNAAERRDVGVATGSLLFLRSMGGAFGSTVTGSLLALGFAAGLQAAGVAGVPDLGAMRPGSPALAALGAAAAPAQAALMAAFHYGFLACAAVVALAAAVAAGTPDVALRSAEPQPIPIES